MQPTVTLMTPRTAGITALGCLALCLPTLASSPTSRRPALPGACTPFQVTSLADLESQAGRYPIVRTRLAHVFSLPRPSAVVPWIQGHVEEGHIQRAGWYPVYYFVGHGQEATQRHAEYLHQGDPAFFLKGGHQPVLNWNSANPINAPRAAATPGVPVAMLPGSSSAGFATPGELFTGPSAVGTVSPTDAALVGGAGRGAALPAGAVAGLSSAEEYRAPLGLLTDHADPNRPAPAPLVPVPEPGPGVTFMLGSLSLLGMIMVVRRGRKGTGS